MCSTHTKLFSVKMKTFSLISAAGASTCSLLLWYTILLHRKNKHLHEQVLRLQAESGKDGENQEEDSGCSSSNGGTCIDIGDGTDENVNMDSASTNSTGNKTKQKKGTKEICNTSNCSDDGRSEYFTLEEIGTITSPYPQRAGTPRQGLLAPHSRSILTLHPSIPKEALDDLEQYSHVWIIFQFHLNPLGKGKSKENTNGKKGNRSDGSNYRSNYVFKSSKIKPPRAQGKKVGLFATRSPHRPNNIGLSLALIESVEQIETAPKIATNKATHDSSNGKIKSPVTRNKRTRKTTIVKLLGLDLVDGTPVYDIKPYIPSDRVMDISSPFWVSNTDDTLAAVTWTEEAKDVVYEEQQSGSLLPIYPPTVLGQNSTKNKNRNQNQKGMVVDAISEIIAQDPRARHDGRQQTGSFEITFCTLRVCFIVKEQIDTPMSSSSNDHRYYAVVNKVFRDPGDITAQVGTYQHSLALRRIEEERRRQGKKSKNHS